MHQNKVNKIPPYTGNQCKDNSVDTILALTNGPRDKRSAPPEYNQKVKYPLQSLDNSRPCVLSNVCTEQEKGQKALMPYIIPELQPNPITQPNVQLVELDQNSTISLDQDMFYSTRSQANIAIGPNSPIISQQASQTKRKPTVHNSPTKRRKFKGSELMDTIFPKLNIQLTPQFP